MAECSVPYDVVNLTTLIWGYGAALIVSKAKLGLYRVIRDVQHSTLLRSAWSSQPSAALTTLFAHAACFGRSNPSPPLASPPRVLYERIREQVVCPKYFACDILVDTLCFFAKETFGGGHICSARLLTCRPMRHDATD